LRPQQQSQPPVQAHQILTQQQQQLPMYQKEIQAHQPQQQQIVQTPTSQASSVKEPEGSFQDVLFTTIEEFDQKQKIFGANPDFNRIAKLLLPLDVFVLYSEHQEIRKDMQSKVDTERTKLDETIDNFLKEVILSMEKVKELINGKISNYHSNLTSFYDQYRQKVENFLK
jgi:flagellar hook-basal body complex protein FliE